MSNDGHTYSWTAPATGWLEFDADGKVIQAERPSQAEFAGEEDASD